jgi:HK97 family phage major capsid protein
MNPSEIKTADDLVQFATETGKRLDEVETAAESAKSIPDITAELKLVKEQLASVHTWVKNVDAKPNSDTEEGALHTLGSIANNMLKAYKAEGDERREASKAIRKMGAVPTRAVSENGKHESFEVAKGYEEKAGASTDPLSSDDSDSGNYFGSYLVPVDTVPELMRIAADNSALMGRVTSRPVRGITTYVPTTTDAMTMTKLTNQETAKTEDNITFSMARWQTPTSIR